MLILNILIYVNYVINYDTFSGSANCVFVCSTSIPETLQKGVQDGPADDGVCFVMVPAVDVGLQGAGGRVDCVTFWNKTWV